jgi:hypothetical protein
MRNLGSKVALSYFMPFSRCKRLLISYKISGTTRVAELVGSAAFVVDVGNY